MLYAAPVLQAITAMLMLIYLMSLLFSYEEMFGRTRPDEPMHLTKADIDEIQSKLEADEEVTE